MKPGTLAAIWRANRIAPVFPADNRSTENAMATKKTKAPRPKVVAPGIRWFPPGGGRPFGYHEIVINRKGYRVREVWRGDLDGAKALRGKLLESDRYQREDPKGDPYTFTKTEPKTRTAPGPTPRPDARKATILGHRYTAILGFSLLAAALEPGADGLTPGRTTREIVDRAQELKTAILESER